MRGLLLALMLIAAPAAAQTFSSASTESESRLDFIVAVADLNGDGRDDILAGGREHEEGEDDSPEGRYDKTALEVFLGQEDGTFAHAPELVDGTIEARQPVVVAADFNGDERTDLAVFDYGVYVYEERVGYGNPPQLWLNGQDGVLRSSEALADAVETEHVLRPPSGKGLSAPTDLHVKSAVAGDIDGDGDIDLWVDSIGGKNVDSHFTVNNGDGTFTIDPERAPYALRHNSPDWWYHWNGDLVDVDNDGDLDLSLGQNRSTDPLHVSKFSIVLVNDGTGRYTTRIELPHPAFSEGYTAVTGQAHSDVNSDGFEDLLLAHRRVSDSQPDVLPDTGRYVQVLINDDGEAFVDETSTRMSDQSLTASERYAGGEPLHNETVPRMFDVDRDGCDDIVTPNSHGPISRESPILYLSNGSGQFSAVDPDETFTDLSWDGRYGAPADVNGDGVIDMVFPQRVLGPDDEYGTEDDSTRFLTLLNITPAVSVRCGS